MKTSHTKINTSAKKLHNPRVCLQDVTGVSAPKTTTPTTIDDQSQILGTKKAEGLKSVGNTCYTLYIKKN